MITNKSINKVAVFFLSLLFLITACREKPQPANAPEPVVPMVPAVPEVKETKTGLASYYGRAFHGSMTAGGEKFDSEAMVAAHPTYPLGTIVRVTNIKKGDTVTVRIADRGPTSVNRKEGVIIDVSRGAAVKLKMLQAGRIKVKVEVLEWAGEKKDTDSTGK